MTDGSWILVVTAVVLVGCALWQRHHQRHVRYFALRVFWEQEDLPPVNAFIERQRKPKPRRPLLETDLKVLWQYDHPVTDTGAARDFRSMARATYPSHGLPGSTPAALVPRAQEDGPAGAPTVSYGAAPAGPGGRP